MDPYVATPLQEGSRPIPTLDPFSFFFF
ncbi:uncharacterized protein G2W53_007997 [Senna tora]|uniref:Uncharacterized protein n=1 Tax=Senna tora TaxID=362788 RepID=A0A834X7N6_9FABA|nr:uncharacterized protein G2W53_007997 [Senna tora]